MNVLITGGAGFIGSHTADRLLQEGHSVRVLDSLEEPVHQNKQKPKYLDDRIEFILGDVCDEKTLLQSMIDCDVVFHFAAFQDYLPIFSKFVDVNVSSTAKIYELIVKHNLPIQKVIVASSQSTLGEGVYTDANGQKVLPDMRTDENLKEGLWNPVCPPTHEPPIEYSLTDESVNNPQNPYGISKIAEEKFALYLGKRYNIPSVAMRYSIVQGSRQSFYNAYSGACRIFCLSFHQNKTPQIYEDGNQIRDYINIHDVVDANILVMNDERANYEMFNVGGGLPITVNEFAKVVAEIFGHEDYKPKPSGKYRFGDTRHIFSDISKLKSLGWSPKRTVHDSVKEYKEWLEDASSIDNIIEYCNQKMMTMDVVRETV